MFNPGQIYKAQQTTNTLIKETNRLPKTSHLDLSSFQNIGKSRWDEPIMLPPVLYTKLGVPFPCSASNPSASINNKYPPQLLNYIGRSYSKCKNESEKMLMENQLRDVIRKYETDLGQVNWDSHPLPSLNKNVQPVGNLPAQNSRNIKLLSCYNIVEDEKPSKAMEIAKKRLEKLEQKLNKEEIKPDDQKQVFIGFSSTPIEQPKFPRFTSTPLAPSSTLPPTVPSKIFEFPKPSILKYENTETNSKEKHNNERQSEKDKQKEKEKDKKGKEKEREREKEKEKEKHRSKSDKDKEDRKEQLSKNREEKVEEKIKNTKSKEEKSGLPIKKSKESELEQMAKRYKGFNKLQNDTYQKDALEDSDVELGEVIVGKSQSIDKPYLRITGRPNPETVRPESVLKRALAFHFHIYEENKGELGYEVLISQLKSIRQDLTVQHIKNSFTVHVYEENLEASLFEKDIPQFKHCQTTLWELYCEGLCYSEESRNKFISHQMLTLLMEDKSQELEFMLTRVPQSCLPTPQIMSCLKLKQQLIVGNYRGFFDFYQRQGKFNQCLLDLYLGKMLIKFLLMICKTCGEKVPVKSLCEMVGAQSSSLLEEIIAKEGGVVDSGMLILKPSFDQFAKSEHLASKKVTVLMN